MSSKTEHEISLLKHQLAWTRVCVCLLGIVLVAGWKAKNPAEENIVCKKLTVVDSDDKVIAVLGSSSKGGGSLNLWSLRGESGTAVSLTATDDVQGATLFLTNKQKGSIASMSAPLKFPPSVTITDENGKLAAAMSSKSFLGGKVATYNNIGTLTDSIGGKED